MNYTPGIIQHWRAPNDRNDRRNITEKTPRRYRGEIIWPKNVYGMYSSIVNSQSLAADTLAGMKSLIREALDRK